MASQPPFHFSESARHRRQYEEAQRIGRIPPPGRVSAAMWTIARWVLLFFAAMIVAAIIQSAWPIGLVALALPVWCVWRLLTLIRR